MRFAIRETDDCVQYILEDRGPITDTQLTEMFYTNRGGVYSRTYAKQNLMFPHDFAAIERNYNRHKEKALTVGFSKDDLVQALTWVADTMSSSQIRWWLTGSAALFVRGVDVMPHDLDVMTYKTEIGKIALTFGPWTIEPFEHATDWVVKGFGVADHSFRLDFAFEPEPDVDKDGILDFGPYAEAHLETVIWKGRPIRVPPLKAQLLSNVQRKRSKVVEGIELLLRRSDA